MTDEIEIAGVSVVQVVGAAPCPFCGSKVDVVGAFCEDDEGRDLWSVVCNACGTTGPAESCPTPQMAVAAWNARPVASDGAKAGMT